MREHCSNIILQCRKSARYHHLPRWDEVTSRITGTLLRAIIEHSSKNRGAIARAKLCSSCNSRMDLLLSRFDCTNIHQKWNLSGSEAWPPRFPSHTRFLYIYFFFTFVVPAITSCSNLSRCAIDNISVRVWDHSTLFATVDRCHLDNLKLMFFDPGQTNMILIILKHDRLRWRSPVGRTAVALTAFFFSAVQNVKRIARYKIIYLTWFW